MYTYINYLSLPVDAWNFILNRRAVAYAVRVELFKLQRNGCDCFQLPYSIQCHPRSTLPTTTGESLKILEPHFDFLYKQQPQKHSNYLVGVDNTTCNGLCLPTIDCMKQTIHRAEEQKQTLKIAKRSRDSSFGN